METGTIPSPTSHLPPIRQIRMRPIGELFEALKYLRRIYIPEVRGSRRLRPDGASKNGRERGLDELRSDAFERSYAIRWLMALISQTEEWSGDLDEMQPSEREREDLVQDAAALLSACSGTAAAGIIVRDFIFATNRERGETLTINLRDVPLDNQDYGSVGAQTWGGACVLAEDIVEHPARYGLEGVGVGLRILELGAGTGLVSLAVAKLLEGMVNAPQSAVVATDYYPSVLTNLEGNIRSNFSPSTSTNVCVTSHTLDWSTFSNKLVHEPPFDEPFDIVLGADIIYEEQHAAWIWTCLQHLLRKPDKHTAERPVPAFHLVIPLRRTHAFESSTIEHIFQKEGTGEQVLGIMSKEVIVCEPGGGLGTEQVEYAYYIIGWC